MGRGEGRGEEAAIMKHQDADRTSPAHLSIKTMIQSVEK